MGLSCAQTRTFPAYSIKLQSGSVSFYNIQEVTVGSTVVETTFVEGKRAKVVVNPGELQSGSWLRTADLKVQVDGSSYFTIPSSVSTETLVVKSLEGTSEVVWSRGGAFHTNIYGDKKYILERDAETGLCRVVSGDGIYGETFTGYDAVRADFLVSSGDVIFNKDELAVKQAIIGVSDFADDLNITTVRISQVGIS